MTDDDDTSSDSIEEQRLAELMVKVVDRVATPAEREELMAVVVEVPDLRAELESQQAFKAVTDGWMSRLEADLAADRDRTNPVRRVERGLGVALILLGIAVMWGWVWVQLLMDPTAPPPIRFGIGALASGGLLLLFHVVRLRWFSGEPDPYAEVIR